MRIKLVSDGSIAGTSIKNADTGEDICCRFITWQHNAGELPRAVIELVGVPIQADVEVVNVKPDTVKMTHQEKRMKPVRRWYYLDTTQWGKMDFCVEYMDGSVLYDKCECCPESFGYVNCTAENYCEPQPA